MLWRKRKRLEVARGGHPRPDQRGHTQKEQKGGQILQLSQPPLYTRPEASKPLQRLEPELVKASGIRHPRTL